MLRKPFREIHFHSLRHTSITEKLRISGGDIKSVQGDAGHKQSKMVTDQYAAIQDEPRRELAQKMCEKSSPQTGKNISPDNAAKVIDLLTAKPELMQLILSLSS